MKSVFLLDTDKHKYPIGSGRVTFNNTKSYMKAVAAAFIEIKTQKFNKKVNRTISLNGVSYRETRAENRERIDKRYDWIAKRKGNG